MLYPLTHRPPCPPLAHVQFYASALPFSLALRLVNGIQCPLRDKILLRPPVSSKTSTGNIKDGGLDALHYSSGSPKAPRPLKSPLTYPLILELANIQPLLGWYHSPGFKVQLKSCFNKPMVSIEELSTLRDAAVLDHPPVTINEHMVNLLCHTASVGIPCPAMSLWALKP